MHTNGQSCVGAVRALAPPRATQSHDCSCVQQHRVCTPSTRVHAAWHPQRVRTSKSSCSTCSTSTVSASRSPALPGTAPRSAGSTARASVTVSLTVFPELPGCCCCCCCCDGLVMRFQCCSSNWHAPRRPALILHTHTHPYPYHYIRVNMFACPCTPNRQLSSCLPHSTHIIQHCNSPCCTQAGTSGSSRGAAASLAPPQSCPARASAVRPPTGWGMWRA